MKLRTAAPALALAALAALVAVPAQADPDNLFGMFGPVVKWVHLYSASDGLSHIEEMPVPASAGPNGMTVLFAKPSTRVSIGYWPDGFQSPWHYATNTNVLLYLQGTQIIDLGDGVEHRLEPGVAVLADDWTGKGHRYRCEAKTGQHVCLVIQLTLGDLERRMPLAPPPSPAGKPR